MLAPPALARSHSVPVNPSEGMSYRKWKRKDEAATEDKLSPECSPLTSVIAFVKATGAVEKIGELRQAIVDQYFRAAFRIRGLQMNERLFSSLPMSRFLQGIQSHSISHQIETCGESMSKTLNQLSKILATQHMTQLAPFSDHL